MAKREYILREEALSHPFANGRYDHKNASIDFILGHESYEEWLEGLTAVTEREIVKPYLDKIRERVEKLQKACDKNDLNLLAQHSAFGMVLDIFDEYKAESEE